MNQNQQVSPSHQAGLCIAGYLSNPDFYSYLNTFYNHLYLKRGKTVPYHDYLAASEVELGLWWSWDRNGTGPKHIPFDADDLDRRYHDLLSDLLPFIQAVKPQPHRSTRPQSKEPDWVTEPALSQPPETLGQTTDRIRDKAQPAPTPPVHRRQYVKGLNFYIQPIFLKNIKSGVLFGKRKDRHESGYQTLNYLHTHIGHRDQSRLWPEGWYSDSTVQDIAKATGYGYNTVRRRLSDLRRMGYIRTIWRGRPGSKIPATLYLVTTRPKDLIIFQSQGARDHPPK